MLLIFVLEGGDIVVRFYFYVTSCPVLLHSSGKTAKLVRKLKFSFCIVSNVD